MGEVMYASLFEGGGQSATVWGMAIVPFPLKAVPHTDFW